MLVQSAFHEHTILHLVLVGHKDLMIYACWSGIFDLDRLIDSGILDLLHSVLVVLWYVGQVVICSLQGRATLLGEVRELRVFVFIPLHDENYSVAAAAGLVAPTVLSFNHRGVKSEVTFYRAGARYLLT